MSTINDLMTAIAANNKAKGFRDREFNVGEVLMLITSELGEALEAQRTTKFAEVEHYNKALANAKEIGREEMDFIPAFKTYIKDTFEDELADAFIRLLDLAERAGVDLAWHVEQKMKYNATRPRLHGKAF